MFQNKNRFSIWVLSEDTLHKISRLEERLLKQL